MDTAVALVTTYLHLNGYITNPEQPVIVGEGRPYRYHTAPDVDVLAVRFPHAAVVIPRDSGRPKDGSTEDLRLALDPELRLIPEAADVLIGEVKEGRPRLNPTLREPEILYATLRRVDPGLNEPLEMVVRNLIAHGEARAHAGERLWRFRLVAFGDGEAVRDGGPFMVLPLRHAAMHLMRTLVRHRAIWRDASFSEPVLDLFHLLDKLGLLRVEAANEG